MSECTSFDVLADRRAPICSMGLGYVGLPLSIAFASRFDVIGFDINATRIQELNEGIDRTEELTTEQLRRNRVNFTTDPSCVSGVRFIIVTVPTPLLRRDKHTLELNLVPASLPN
jgi:UDP-N-acetyl-D-galactosamine dehydrogenase